LVCLDEFEDDSGLLFCLLSFGLVNFIPPEHKETMVIGDVGTPPYSLRLLAKDMALLMRQGGP
jgi:hypothetical protein